ncbi:MAG: DUF1929 domain-containing protein [Stigonema ocellatum SAG 48.90 = DSM 106950]|nr:DUF1929 domain-containing protein [Stigonema ocellatum SAG 48.90 = DSM 106950]
MPWKVVSNCPINPIHAALLRTGKVLFFSGSGNDLNNVANAPQGAALWDVTNNTFSPPQIPLDSRGKSIDVFCAGQAFRSDGTLLVAGGTIQYDPFFGQISALIFDPSTEKWTQVASMNKGRWYPTLVTLGSGRVFALSGYDINGNLGTNPEIFSGSSWNVFSRSTSGFDLYPHLFLLSNGNLFFSGIQFSDNNLSPRILTIPGSFTQAIAEQAVSGFQQIDSVAQGASVLLPPAQNQKVMILGGANANGVATNRVNIIDLSATNPKYVPAPYLNYPRTHLSAVLLPDRTVFVSNGSQANEDLAQSTLPAEIYNPATNTWTVVETPTVNGRVYHSVALLLPDGTVMIAGGNPQRGTFEPRIEIYSPAYISKTRPVIQSAPSSVGYGKQITIQTPQAGSIKWVNLIRPMATTHSLDTEQRLVDVPINSRTSSSLTVTVTSNQNLAPTGWYMLSITDNNNIPSVAKWIQLS